MLLQGRIKTESMYITREMIFRSNNFQDKTVLKFIANYLPGCFITPADGNLIESPIVFK